MSVTVIPVLAMVAGILMWALFSNTVVRAVGTAVFGIGVLVMVMLLFRVSWRVGEVQGKGAARQCYMSRVRLLSTTYLD